MERAGERGLSIIIPRNSTREGKEGKSKKVRMRGDGRGRGRGGFSKAPRRRGPTTSPAVAVANGLASSGGEGEASSGIFRRRRHKLR